MGTWKILQADFSKEGKLQEMAPLSLAEKTQHLGSGLCILQVRESSVAGGHTTGAHYRFPPQAQIWVLYGMFLQVIFYIVTYHAILPSERVKTAFKRLWQPSHDT